MVTCRTQHNVMSKKKQLTQPDVKAKRSSKRTSTKSLSDAGQLGVVTPQAKPNSMSMSDYFKSILHIVVPGVDKTFGEVIIEKQCQLAGMGSVKSAEFIFDRAYGRPSQTIQVSTDTPAFIVEHQVVTIEQALKDTNGE